MKPALFRALILTCLWFVVAGGSTISAGDEPSSGQKTELADATVLIIRHADKPDSGDGLSPAGVARANAYVSYFANYHIDGKPIKLTALFAAADSKGSRRPHLTLEPLGRGIGLSIDSQYKDKDYGDLVQALQSTDHGKGILICWHHGEIANVVRALGGDPDQLLPGGKWPADQYGWVVQLQYDSAARLQAAKLVVEGF